MTGTIRIRAPFAGFYCSVHDMEFDSQLDLINKDENGEDKNILCQSNVDWRMVRLAYIQAYVGKLSEAIELPMRYAEMVSPRFYNFETDALYVDMPKDAVAGLHAKTMADPDLANAFRTHVHDVLEPRSGFIPFYSNDLADWGDLDAWGEVQTSVLLDHHAAVMELDEADIATELGEICHNAIWGAVIDPGKVREMDGDEDPSP